MKEMGRPAKLLGCLSYKLVDLKMWGGLWHSAIKSDRAHSRYRGETDD